MITVSVRIGPNDSENEEWLDGGWYAESTWMVPEAALLAPSWCVPITNGTHDGFYAILANRDAGFHMGTGRIVVYLLASDIRQLIKLLVHDGYRLGLKEVFEKDEQAMKCLQELGSSLDRIALLEDDEFTPFF
jgi:hypothetical protein